MHHVLNRQLKKIFQDSPSPSFPEWKMFLKTISGTYEHADEDRTLLEHSLDLSSKEFLKLTNDLSEAKAKVDEEVRIRTRELKEEQVRLVASINSLSLGFILADKNAKILLKNKAIHSLLGIPDDGFCMELIDERLGAKAALHEAWQRCIETRQTIAVEDTVYAKKILHILLAPVIMTRDHEEVIGFVCLIEDVTEAKLFIQSKNQFLAITSHQLRTPLTIETGNIELLLTGAKGELNEEQRKILNNTQIASRRLISLVNDILDVVKIEAKELAFQTESLDAEVLLTEVIESLKSLAVSHNIEIIFKREGKKKPVVVTNAVRLKQAFLNLIDNAIRYSHSSGTVLIELTTSDTHLEVRIKDHGIGIPEGEQSKIFQQFFRTQNAVKHIAIGSGLGLYIVKIITEKLGGTIRFESKEAEGTTFFFTLPFAPTTQ